MNSIDTQPPKLDKDRAWELARRCLLVPYFPHAEPAAVQFVAGELMLLCRRQFSEGRDWTAEEQAVWLLDRITTWERWQGLGAFRDRFTRQFIPGDDPDFEQRNGQRRDLWNQEATAGEVSTPQRPDCMKCDDYGVLRVNDETQYCDCAQAAWLRENLPDYIEICRRNEKAFQPPPPVWRMSKGDLAARMDNPITQADIERHRAATRKSEPARDDPRTTAPSLSPRPRLSGPPPPGETIKQQQTNEELRPAPCHFCGGRGCPECSGTGQAEYCGSEHPFEGGKKHETTH